MNNWHIVDFIDASSMGILNDTFSTRHSRRDIIDFTHPWKRQTE